MPHKLKEILDSHQEPRQLQLCWEYSRGAQRRQPMMKPFRMYFPGF